jgi:hypothetical protein
LDISLLWNIFLFAKKARLPVAILPHRNCCIEFKACTVLMTEIVVFVGYGMM